MCIVRFPYHIFGTPTRSVGTTEYSRFSPSSTVVIFQYIARYKFGALKYCEHSHASNFSLNSPHHIIVFSKIISVSLHIFILVKLGRIDCNS